MFKNPVRILVFDVYTKRVQWRLNWKKNHFNKIYLKYLRDVFFSSAGALHLSSSSIIQ